MEPIVIEVKKIQFFDKGELEELTSATMNAVDEGIGFGWITKPPKNKVKDYWQGVLLVPNRDLFIGKYKEIVSGSIQVVTFSSTNEAAIFRVSIDTHFVATWARGHGLCNLGGLCYTFQEQGVGLTRPVVAEKTCGKELSQLHAAASAAQSLLEAQSSQGGRVGFQTSTYYSRQGVWTTPVSWLSPLTPFRKNNKP